jgi:Peptidase propeptide and YPEB domain
MRGKDVARRASIEGCRRTIGPRARAGRECCMNARNNLIRISLAAFVGLAAGAAPALATAKSGVLQKGKISMSQARAIALKAYPGKIVKEELERERGGSGLRYSFDLRQGKKWREVGVDAMTGRVLENVHEGANPKD